MGILGHDITPQDCPFIQVPGAGFRVIPCGFACFS
jgi:hypothetical protein